MELLNDEFYRNLPSTYKTNFRYRHLISFIRSLNFFKFLNNLLKSAAANLKQVVF